MSDDIDTKKRHPSSDNEQEPKKFRADLLTDEQLAMLASTWDTVKQSDTPMTDLRAAMGSSDLFDGLYDVNNLELRTLATSAHTTLENRHTGPSRADELRAILGAVSDKTIYMDKRAALSDLLGFDTAHHMTNQDIDAFIADAQTELASLEASSTSTDTNDQGEKESTPNQDLASQVSDLLGGKLVVNAEDRVQYGSGATALGRKVGGQFASVSQLRDIAAHADQIRDGLVNRGTPDDFLAGDTVTPSHDTSASSTTPGMYDRAADTTASVSGSPDMPAYYGSTSGNDGPDLYRSANPERPLVLTFVDQTYDAIAAARDAAEARRRNELAQGGKIKRFFRNMWKGENGIAGAYYLEKYKREALAKIEEEGDIFAHESTDLIARERAQMATIEHMQMEYDEDLGERREELSGDSEFSLATKDLLRRYVSGEISDKEALSEEFGRLLEHLAKTGNQELIGEGRVRINNLFAIGEQIKAMDDHEAALERIKIYTGESRSNVRSEAKLNKTEKVIERLQQSKYTAWISPETISTAAAVALGVARVGRGTVLRAAGVTLAPGVIGGVTAGFRESTRVKQEYALHAREMAQGKRHEAGERRSELDEALYEMADAKELTTQLDTMLTEGSTPTPEEIQAAYETLAMADARKCLSNKRGIDLIRYTHPVKIPEERRDLAMAVAQAKVRLARHLGDLPQDFRDRFSISAGQPIDDSLTGYTEAIVELDADINKKDAIFRKVHHRRVRKAVAVGVVTSALIGFGAQEALAFVNPSYDGLAEHLVHGGSPSEHGTQTTLEGAREAVFGHGSSAHVEHTAPSKIYDSYPLGTHEKALELPSDYHAVAGANGVITIEGPKGFAPIEGLTLEKNGSFTQHSLEVLREHNVSISDTGGMTNGPEIDTPQKLTVAEYNKLHSAHITHVTRDFWYDNSTTRSDANELKLWWGGTNNNGIGPNGDIQMNVSHMTAGGSEHGGEHASWVRDARDSKLKLAVSASRDTQTYVYFVDVKPNGTIDIPKDSPASKFFSVDKSGQVEFNGAYAEVVEVRGQVGGVTHIAPLSTEVGSNSLHEITENVPTHHSEYVPHVKLTPPSIEHTVAGRTVEGFGGPSIVPRKPLEKVEAEAYTSSPIEGSGIYGLYGDSYANYGYEYGGGSLVEVWERERSPRLKNDPEHQLSAQEELNWYFDERSANMKPGYIAELDRRVDNDAVLDNIPANIELMINIPVAAAYEKDNIYKTLALYAKQDSESLAKTQIVLSLNWKEGVDMADVEATRAEVERARTDFPQLNIATFEEVWPQEFVASRRGKIYGMVVKSLYDTSMRAVQRGNSKHGSNADPLIVTNDADAADMSKNYLKQLIKAKHEFGEADVFSAKIHWGVDSFKNYPGFGVVSSFLSLAEDRFRDSYRNKPGGGSWGANSAFRTSALAATGGANGNRGEGVDGEMGRRIRFARANGARDVPRRTLEPVRGAWIDTAPERQLEAYKNNVLLTDSWNDFSTGGYQPRPDLAVGGEAEDVIADFDIIKSRIEHQMSGMLSSNWDIGGRDENVIEAALENIFYKPDNTKLWNITGSGDDVTFTFTDAGAAELKVVLETIHDSTKEGLAMIDEVYSNTQASV